jgi:hypothetical protein
MTSFFDVIFVSSGRAPIAVVDRLTQAANALFNRVRPGLAPDSDRPRPVPFRDNHLRRDVGLPPIEGSRWPLP